MTHRPLRVRKNSADPLTAVSIVLHLSPFFPYEEEQNTHTQKNKQKTTKIVTHHLKRSFPFSFHVDVSSSVPLTKECAGSVCWCGPCLLALCAVAWAGFLDRARF